MLLPLLEVDYPPPQRQVDGKPGKEFSQSEAVRCLMAHGMDGGIKANAFIHSIHEIVGIFLQLVFLNTGLRTSQPGGSAEGAALCRGRGGVPRTSSFPLLFAACGGEREEGGRRTPLKPRQEIPAPL
jgi:hypothetical protein